MGRLRSSGFWLDRWCGDQPFNVRFPSLFAISASPMAKVAENWINNGWAPAFRRSLDPIESGQWEVLCTALVDQRITPGRDVVSWILDPSGNFSTGSIYREIFKTTTPYDLSWIWSARIPSKIKKILWQVARKRIPSGDQVKKRNGPGDDKCVWCGQDDSCDHIIFQCIVARFTWSVLRAATGCSWNPSNFTDVYRLMRGTNAQDRNVA